MTQISAEIAFQRREGKVYYFNGHLPVFVHEEALPQAQRLLDEGWNIPRIAQELGILTTTLHKAVGDGRLRRDRVEKKDRAPARRVRRAKASAA